VEARIWRLFKVPIVIGLNGLSACAPSYGSLNSSLPVIFTARVRHDGSRFAGLWLGGKMNGLFVCEEVPLCELDLILLHSCSNVLPPLFRKLDTMTLVLASFVKPRWKL
jgi:hypothetical protein